MIRTKLSITNDETGEWEVLFYENEKICENLEVNIESSKIARQYSAYSLILDDINLLLKWAKELNNKISVFEKKQSNGSSGKNRRVIEEGADKEELKSELFQSFTALCIIYGRLFSGNQRGTTLQRNNIEKKYHDIHDGLIKLRNEYIAHSSSKTYEESKVFVILNPNDATKFRVVYHTCKVYFHQNELLEEIIEYFEHLSLQIIFKHDQLKNKIEEEYRKEKLVFKPKD